MKLLAFLFLFSTFAFSQNKYPQDYFISPLNIPLDLSGSFGELRSNHFHSGLDFTTNKTEGLPVYAAADGYVSRIKISTFGYGKAIYITHNNGFTTVYAHLQKANGEIESYIKKNQYKEKSYEVEMFPKANELFVRKGDIIAFSGNTGGSSGPHLHFEFRDTKTEKIINPLHFGFNKIIRDDRKPEVYALIAYPIDSSLVNESEKPISLSITKQTNGTFLAKTVKTNGKVAFGINAYDFCTNAYNKNGLYKANAYLNGVLYFTFDFETFSFDETRYINHFLDYERLKSLNQRVQKLFYKQPYPLTIINKNTKNGIIAPQPNTTYTYKIELLDFHGNKTEVIVPIEYANQQTKISNKIFKTNYFVKAARESIFKKDNFTVTIPENAFYEDFYMSLEKNSNLVMLHNEKTPIHKAIKLTINDNSISEDLKDKTFIALVEGAELSYNKTYQKDGSYSANIKSFGNYKLAQDTAPPRIYNVNFVEGKTLTQKTISVSINDLLSGIDTYNAYLNGNWILMEYDHKTKKLIHNLSDGIAVKGKNELKIVVIDNLKNSAIFESYFYL